MDTPFKEQELLEFSKKHSKSFHILANRRDSAVLHLDKGVYRLSRSPNSLMANAHALKLLESHSVAPKLLIEEESYTVEEYIDGTEFQLTEKLLEMIFINLLKIHAIKGEQQNWEKHLKERYLERFEQVDPKYTELFFSNLQPLEEASLLHGMLEANNILWKKRPYFVDFCDSCFGEKEFDIGALYYKEFFPLELLEKLCSQYGYNLRKVLQYALYFGIKTVGKTPSEYKEKKIESIYRMLL